MKNSRWIWINKDPRNNEYVEFLSTIDYKSGNILIKLSVDTEYALFINGEYVTSGQYADFPWYKVYDEINITAYLTEGKNEVRILAWFMGDNNYCHYVNRAGLRFEILSDDGLLDSSDERTLCRPCPYLASGEGIRKLNRQLGYSFIWEETAPAEYSRAAVVDGMPSELIKRPIKSLEALPLLTAEGCGKVYDLGAETVGYPYIELCAERGEPVTVSFAEWVRADGSLPRIMFDGRYDFSFDIIGTGEKQIPVIVTNGGTMYCHIKEVE